MVKAINTWAVSLMWYSAGIVEWTKEDLDVTDRRTRKLMTHEWYASFAAECEQTLSSEVRGR